MAGCNVVENTTKQRDSNIELLRIFAMFIIVMNHFNTHGIFKFWHLNDSFLLKVNNFISATACLGGKLGVMIFVLITGYFLVDSKFKISRVLIVFLKTLLYSILIFAIVVIFAGDSVTTSFIKHSLSSIGLKGYWFMEVYVILLLFSPFINIFFNAITKDLLKYFLILTTTIWFVFPILFQEDYCFSELASFICLYIFGAVIKRGYFDKVFNTKTLCILAGISLMIFLGHNVFILLKDTVRLGQAAAFTGLKSILTLSIALAIFKIFSTIKIGYNKYINGIAASVFAVYLIHDNSLVRPFLWQKLFNVVQYITSPCFVFYMIGITLVIFITCIFIDKIFDFIFNKPINFVSNKVEQIVSRK